MTTAPVPDHPEYRRPTAGPEPVSRAERAAFAALVAQSLPAVRASAQSWRNGLTGLITLATTGVFLQGRTTTAELGTGWRTAVTLLIGGGLGCATVGLWQALSAEAGSRTVPTTLAEIHASHASVAAYDVARANVAGVGLRRARNATALALALLLAGVVATWWAPAKTPSPPAYVRVTGPRGDVCGTVRSADGGQLRLTVAGRHEPVVIPLADLVNLVVVKGC